MKQYYVYIVASKSRVLYTRVTNDILRRVTEHKQKKGSEFTSKYNIDRLVFFEPFSDVRAAISREKQIKGWKREKKINLIESINPDWKDLSEGWYEEDKEN